MNTKNALVGKVADQMTQVLLRAEDSLRKLNLGVTAQVDLAEGELRFGKFSNRWCLTFLYDDPRALWTPIQSTTTQVRLAAIKAIPELVIELRAESDRTAVDIRNAIQTLSEYLDDLDRTQGKG